MYKTLPSKNSALIFFQFIVHWRVNTNYSKIIIIKLFKVCLFSQRVSGKVDTFLFRSNFILQLILIYIIKPINNYYHNFAAQLSMNNWSKILKKKDYTEKNICSSKNGENSFIFSAVISISVIYFCGRHNQVQCWVYRLYRLKLYFQCY